MEEEIRKAGDNAYPIAVAHRVAEQARKESAVPAETPPPAPKPPGYDPLAALRNDYDASGQRK